MMLRKRYRIAHMRAHRTVLDLAPSKRKLHMKGVSIDTAHDLVRQCIDADNDMECLRPFLVRHEDPAQDVIQVDGIRVAAGGAPRLHGIRNQIRTVRHREMGTR